VKNSSDLGVDENRRRIGDRWVTPVGLGCLRLSYFGDVTVESGVEVILAALESGMTLLDTADVYGPPHVFGVNEELIKKALAAWKGDRDQILVATKGGHERLDDDTIVPDGRPSSLIKACERSLCALGVDRIDLYQYHSVDPKVPLAESVGALRDLQQSGKIGMIGLSNIGRRQLAEAVAEAPIVSVQNEFSPFVQKSAGVVAECEGRNIAFLSWSPVGGRPASELLQRWPRIAEYARRLGVSPYVVAVAWQLSVGPHVIPIPGATTAEHARANAQAATLDLSDLDISKLFSEPG
jgi:aryl-alcohol dehydrogenase-like predicted oxidoreductase